MQLKKRKEIATAKLPSNSFSNRNLHDFRWQSRVDAFYPVAERHFIFIHV